MCFLKKKNSLQKKYVNLDCRERLDQAGSSLILRLKLDISKLDPPPSSSSSTTAS